MTRFPPIPLLQVPAGSPARAILLALALVGAVYALLAVGRSRAAGPSGRAPWWLWLDPAVLSSNPYGKASISSMQLLWFTLIVFYGAARDLFAGQGLAVLSPDILPLLGVPGASKIASGVISGFRSRISLENWNWLVDQKFLKECNSIDPRMSAGWKDLLLTDGVFDPVRFQLFSFSFLIGIAMLLGGDLAGFKIGSWNTFLFSSNVVYLGGKALSPAFIKELDDRITSIRHQQSHPGVPSEEDRRFIRRVLISAFGRASLNSQARN